MTVGELRHALDGFPDDMEIVILYDTECGVAGLDHVRVAPAGTVDAWLPSPEMVALVTDQ